jgi:hypothetical protein
MLTAADPPRLPEVPDSPKLALMWTCPELVEPLVQAARETASITGGHRAACTHARKGVVAVAPEPLVLMRTFATALRGMLDLPSAAASVIRIRHR